MPESDAMPPHSIATRLFRVSFQYYVAFALALTGLLVVGEYLSAKATLRDELTTYQHAFEGALGSALWAMDGAKLDAIVSGMVELDAIIGVRVSDPATGRRFVVARGDGPSPQLSHDGGDDGERLWAELERAAAFRHAFDVSYRHATGTALLGRVEILTGRAQLIERIRGQSMLILAIALFKEAVLWGIFLLVGRRFLMRPLRHLIAALRATRPERPTAIALPAAMSRDVAGSELTVVRDTFNALIDRIEDQRAQLVAINSRLEQQVAERTSALEDANRGLRDQAQLLAASNTELEQFAYVASHDLRQPLRLVNSYLDLLERRHGDALDPEARGFVAYARDGARRMDRLIRDLLSLSRIGRTGHPFAATPFERVVADGLAPLRDELEAAGGSVAIADHLPVVWGDGDELTRLVTNLVGNAIKYRAPDRAVAIAVGWRPGDGAEAVFWVRDNGMGIAPEHFERIFQIFQRLHLDGPSEGTGIGLAICRKIVDRHGGRIWVESEADQGSSFYFALPLAAPDHSPFG